MFTLGGPPPMSSQLGPSVPLGRALRSSLRKHATRPEDGHSEAGAVSHRPAIGSARYEGTTETVVKQAAARSQKVKSCSKENPCTSDAGSGLDVGCDEIAATPSHATAQVVLGAAREQVPRPGPAVSASRKSSEPGVATPVWSPRLSAAAGATVAAETLVSECDTWPSIDASDGPLRVVFEEVHALIALKFDELLSQLGSSNAIMTQQLSALAQQIERPAMEARLIVKCEELRSQFDDSNAALWHQLSALVQHVERSAMGSSAEQRVEEHRLEREQHKTRTHSGRTDLQGTGDDRVDLGSSVVQHEGTQTHEQQGSVQTIFNDGAYASERHCAFPDGEDWSAGSPDAHADIEKTGRSTSSFRRWMISGKTSHLEEKEPTYCDIRGHRLSEESNKSFDDLVSTSHLRTFWIWLGWSPSTPTSLNILNAASILCVMANALFMGVEQEVGMKSALASAPLPRWVYDTQLAFTVLIGIELAARVALYGRTFFSGRDVWWNLFDSILVITAIMEHVIEFLDLSFARILRALRMLRVARLFRLFKPLTALRLMVALVVSSLASVVWIFVFLGMFLYMAAIFFMQALTNHLVQSSFPEPLIDDVREFYSTVAYTMLSLFAAISGGADWLDVAMPLKELGIEYFSIFAMFIAFVTMGLMNIVTSIFVESAKKLYEVDADLVIQEQMSHSKSYANQLKSILASSDVDKSNTVTKKELNMHLGDHRVKAHLAALEIEKSDVLSVFDLLRLDDAEVSVDDLIIALLRLHGNAKAVDMATLIYADKRHAKRLYSYMAYSETQIRDIQDSLTDLRRLCSGQSFSRPGALPRRGDDRACERLAVMSRGLAATPGAPQRETGAEGMAQMGTSRD
mmetsp:Transcript_81895/g.228202  ORF Transcript_81895/g.228202 Transcript_81895/m.228202 type:complete len:859 (-) Transcript_81895:8-2584(-)